VCVAHTLSWWVCVRDTHPLGEGREEERRGGKEREEKGKRGREIEGRLVTLGNKIRSKK
jgi:hypothetical protein